jgi:hypothetical protein
MPTVRPDHAFVHAAVVLNLRLTQGLGTDSLKLHYLNKNYTCRLLRNKYGY